MSTIKLYIILSLTIATSLTIAAGDATAEPKFVGSMSPEPEVDAPKPLFSCISPLIGYCASPYKKDGVSYYVSSVPISGGKYDCNSYGGSNSSCCDPAKLKFTDPPSNQIVLAANYKAACPSPRK
ncbi:hypothetical protein PSTT_03785 [Puccinia striiformis]|uniref:Uncharacterized protein n=1 Tax=Puccinia striiformis TaxID=27350 RepID=A0A2S4VUY0_9BASI|nr:hypothetical protein PSTT_03785 [Puccinia striiformis]